MEFQLTMNMKKELIKLREELLLPLQLIYYLGTLILLKIKNKELPLEEMENL